jgi:hypothetical protein
MFRCYPLEEVIDDVDLRVCFGIKLEGTNMTRSKHVSPTSEKGTSRPPLTRDYLVQNN